MPNIQFSIVFVWKTFVHKYIGLDGFFLEGFVERFE